MRLAKAQMEKMEFWKRGSGAGCGTRSYSAPLQCQLLHGCYLTSHHYQNPESLTAQNGGWQSIHVATVNQGFLGPSQLLHTWLSKAQLPALPLRGEKVNAHDCQLGLLNLGPRLSSCTGSLGDLSCPGCCPKVKFSRQSDHSVAARQGILGFFLTSSTDLPAPAIYGKNKRSTHATTHPHTLVHSRLGERRMTGCSGGLCAARTTESACVWPDTYAIPMS